MKKILVTIQQNQFSNQQIKDLQQVLLNHYQKHVSSEKPTVIWCIVPTGQAYTEYKPSQSSLVTMECCDNFPQSQRIAMLKDCERDWLAITGQHPDQLLLALVESHLFQQILKSNQSRLSALGRLRMGLHLLKSFSLSTFRHGLLAFNPNL